MKRINAFIALTFLRAYGVNSFTPSSSLNSNTRFNTIGFKKSSNRAHIFNVPTFTSSKSALNAARRPLLSEDDLAAPPSEKVIEAVQRLGGNDVLASGMFIKVYVMTIIHRNPSCQSILTASSN